MNPQVLAFVGDAVHTLYVRMMLALTHTAKSGDLQKMAVAELSAVAQAEHAAKIVDRLTPEELAIFKRGRNTKVHSVAKSASVAQYMHATGYEALIGYLYLIGNEERIEQLIQMQ